LNAELQALHAQNAIDAARYRVIRAFAIMPERQLDAILETIPDAPSPSTPEEVGAHTDILMTAIGNAYADVIHAPPVMQEIDPTHRQGCCGKCKVPCEEGAGG